MQRNVHQSAKRHRANLRQPLDGRWIQCAIANDAQTPGAFSDEHVATGDKHQSPRVIESLRDHRDVRSIRAFAKIPGTVSKCGRPASRSASAATPAAALALTAWSIGRLLSGGGLSRTRLPLLACPDMSRQKKEGSRTKRQ
jgi:hypothetical protein